MKRVLGLILAYALLTFGLASCTQEDGETDNTTNTSEIETPAPDQTEEPGQNEPEPPDGIEKTLRLTGTTTGIHIFGKRLYVDRNYLACDYSGSGIEFVVESDGGSLEVATRTDAECRFLVTLDGEVQQYDGAPYATVNGDQDIVLSNLSAGKHTVKIIKLTGYEQARAAFLTLHFYGTLLTDEAAPDQDVYIEFLGGSAASGIGSAGDYTDQDATRAYTYLLAEQAEAEYSILALADSDLMEQMSQAYLCSSIKRDAETLYAFEKKADVTVIHIGSAGEDAASFTAAYRALVASIHENNGMRSKIVCVYHTSDTIAATAISTICAELGGEEAGMFSVGVSQQDTGALTAEEQQALADEIAPVLEEAIAAEVTAGMLEVGSGDADMSIDHNDPEWNS